MHFQAGQDEACAGLALAQRRADALEAAVAQARRLDAGREDGSTAGARMVLLEQGMLTQDRMQTFALCSLVLCRPVL